MKQNNRPGIPDGGMRPDCIYTQNTPCTKMCMPNASDLAYTIVSGRPQKTNGIGTGLYSDLQRQAENACRSDPFPALSIRQNASG